MKAEKIKISNYKSLGNERNELSISDGLTVIIGKNESGKTNIAEAAGELDFFKMPYRIDDSEKKLNRNSDNGEIIITLTACNKDKPSGETEIIARKDGIKVSGALVESMLADSELHSCLVSLENAGGKAKEIAVRFCDKFCQNPYFLLNDLRQTAEKEAVPRIKSLLHDLNKKTAQYVKELPYVLFSGNNDKNSFREYYFLDEIASLKSDDIFVKLLTVAKVTAGMFDSEYNTAKQKAPAQNGASTDSRHQTGEGSVFAYEKPLARELLKAGLESVAAKFSEFSGKTFSLGYEIKNGRLCLISLFQGKRVMLDELPISEKWHFALFIDILWHNIKNKNIVFVFDQPGLYMHVNAQKDLLKIFKSITKRGHQIIYTTHSPFLLDINDIASMRAVEKQDGQTCIYNKIYAGDITKGSKMETLTPIFEALGVSFSPRQGSEENRLNLIVEGISDYYYIKAMLFYFYGGEDNAPYVLPSVGASNIGNVASILIGWGMPFKAIVDYDEEGKKAADKMQYNLGLKPGKDIFYINGKKFYRADGNCRVEDMLDKPDRAKIQTARGKRTKALVSREFYDLIVSGNLVPSSVTVSNFKTLFNALKI